MRRGGEGRGNRRGRCDGDRGQATVEFALILPLLVICVAGVVWIGLVVTTQVRLEHAAREGARAAAVEPLRASAQAATAVARSMPDAVVSTSVGGEYVVVSVSTEVSGVRFVGVGARTLEAEAHMRREDLLD